MQKPLKKCSRCGTKKPIDEFNLRMSVAKGLVPRAWCKACEHVPPTTLGDKTKESRRVAQVYRRYGITQEEVNALGEKQGWLCYICYADILDKYYIDHDHTTGIVRKLLCLNCNVALGHYHDSIEL